MRIGKPQTDRHRRAFERLLTRADHPPLIHQSNLSRVWKAHNLESHFYLKPLALLADSLCAITYPLARSEPADAPKVAISLIHKLFAHAD